jgi:hypothetical protein
MPRLTNRPPKYRFHKASGQAVVTIGGRDFYLGQYDSDETWAEYRRLVAEWCGRPAPTPPRKTKSDAGAARELTVDELIASYWEVARIDYRKNGSPTSMLDSIRSAVAPYTTCMAIPRQKRSAPLP